jgi:hypothetical protein
MPLPQEVQTLIHSKNSNSEFEYALETRDIFSSIKPNTSNLMSYDDQKDYAHSIINKSYDGIDEEETKRIKIYYLYKGMYVFSLLLKLYISDQTLYNRASIITKMKRLLFKNNITIVKYNITKLRLEDTIVNNYIESVNSLFGDKKKYIGVRPCCNSIKRYSTMIDLISNTEKDNNLRNSLISSAFLNILHCKKILTDSTKLLEGESLLNEKYRLSLETIEKVQSIKLHIQKNYGDFINSEEDLFELNYKNKLDEATRPRVSHYLSAILVDTDRNKSIF